MSRIFCICFVLSIFVFALPLSIVHGAGQWAEPVVTQPWAEPVVTQPWTESVVTDPWAQPVVTDPWGEDLEASEALGTPGANQTWDFVDYRELLGTWYIWTPGVVTPSVGELGAYAGAQMNPGQAQGMIVVETDGSYTMRHNAWQGDTIVTGRWRLSYPREINGDPIQAIILEAGISNADWAIAPGMNGKIRLLWATYWNDGSATWAYDSELYQIEE